MATATAKKSGVSVVTLTLDREEALLLWHLLRRLQESPNKKCGIQTVKPIGDAIREAIANAFAGDVGWSQLDSVAVIGGNATVRSDSLAHLDPAKGAPAPF